MDEIPDDIQKAAEQTQDRAIERCKVAKLAVYEYPFSSGAAKSVLDDEIARALLAEREAATKAERERCALITQKWNYQPMNTAHAIATAIRSGARP